MKGIRPAAVLSVVVALLWAAGPAGATGVPPQLTEAESRALAQFAAGQALAAFVPPPGAVASATEPPGRIVPVPLPAQFRENVVAVHGWWLVSGTPVQAIGWVKEHPPAGAREGFSANFVGGGPREPANPALPTAVGFDWPGVPGARGTVRLEASARTLPGGKTAIEVSAQGFWLTPRPAAEAVPPGSTLLRLSVVPYPFGSRGEIVRQRPLLIRSRSRIERVATLVNALPLAQPQGGPRPCPAPMGVVVRLAFYRRPLARPVAVVRDNLVPCGGVQLELAGREEPSLEEGFDLVGQVSEAIGTKIDTRLTQRRPAG